MKKHFLLIAALVSAFTLVACGGGSNHTEEVATENLSVAITADNVAALSTEEFVFGAVPDFGTTAATTVTFTGTSTTPAFSISSGGNTATGVTTFGSCIFTINSSTFASTHPLASGNVIEVDPCSLRVETRGVTTDESRDVVATLTLGTTTSARLTVEVTVAEDGTVTVNGEQVGTVDTAPTTGAGS